MRKNVIVFLVLTVFTFSSMAQNLPAKKEVLDKMVPANTYFMKK